MPSSARNHSLSRLFWYPFKLRRVHCSGTQASSLSPATCRLSFLCSIILYLPDVKRWTGAYFEDIQLRDLGFKIMLGHEVGVCLCPSPLSMISQSWTYRVFTYSLYLSAIALVILIYACSFCALDGSPPHLNGLATPSHLAAWKHFSFSTCKGSYLRMTFARSSTRYRMLLR